MLIHELSEYIWFIIIVCILVVFLAKKATRKATLKVIVIVIASVGIFTLIMAIGFHLFKGVFILGFMLLLFNALGLFGFGLSLKYLTKELKLTKHGYHTNGTVIEVAFGRGGHNTIKYMVNDKEYKIINSWPCGKWKVGYDNVPILYDDKNPAYACVEKYDIISSVFLITGTSILEIGIIIATIFSIMSIN